MNLFPQKTVWQAQNLPDGLTFKDGVISGKPNARGIYTVPVTVTNELGTSTANIIIKARYRDDVTIMKDGAELEVIGLPELITAIQEGTAQSKYNCTTTQMLITLIHPLTGAVLNDIPLNFCSFRTVTLEDGTTKTGLILQFAKTLWKGFAPFGTNGFNRWKYSQLRKWLNASGASWFTSSYTADTLTPHEGSYTDNGIKGFLSYLPSALVEAILPVKVITQAFFDDYNEDAAIDDPDYVNGHDADVTYDKVFIPSFSEMGITGNDEFFPDTGFEGTTWDYYSALSNGNAICRDFDDTSCSVITRSAYLDGTDKIIYVNNQLQPSAGNVYNADSASAPAFVIG